MMTERNLFSIGNRQIDAETTPLVIAEIGINHDGQIDKAIQMVDDALSVGCECVKFQCHIIEDEMVPNEVIPANADTSIWNIIESATLTLEQDIILKAYVEQKGGIYLSTPFSRAAAVQLESMGVIAYKIGSGECNNYPLIDLIASYGKPIILSTGMNDLRSIDKAVTIMRKHGVDFALLQCTSVYPTPYSQLDIGVIPQFLERYPDAVVGLSDHSLGNYSAFGAVALGARIIEKHFTSDRNWPGPDNSMSIIPPDLEDLIKGTTAVAASLGNSKRILIDEQPTIDFAYASVVAIRDISPGTVFSEDNLWVKRPGTGQIRAEHFHEILGHKALRFIPMNSQIDWDMIDG